MIRKLSLSGWKSHEKTEVEFSPGTNVFVGIMGSGKSSILQGLTFALFGEIPEVRSRKISNSELIMRKPRRLSKATVEVEFDDGEFVYKVRRTIEDDGTKAKLFKEGKILEVGVRRVTRRVSEILRIDYETFVNVVYARQNNIDNFLRYNKTERVKMIDGLLNIDKLEDARKKLRSFHTGVKSKIPDLKERAGKDVSEAKLLLKKAEQDIEEAKGELSDLQTSIPSMREKLSVKKLKFDDMDRKRSKREELNSRLNRLKGERDSLDDRISELPEVSNAKEKLSKAERNLEKIEMKETSLMSGLAEKRGRKEQIEKQLERLGKHKKTAGMKIKDVGPELKKARKRVLEIQAQMDSSSKAVEQLESADAKCPVCNSSLKDPQEHIKRHKDKIIALRKKLASAQKKAAVLEKQQEENDALRIRIEKAKELVKQIPDLEKELKGIDVKTLQADIKSLVEKKKEARKRVQKAEKAVERENLEKKLERVFAEIKSLEGKFKVLGFNESEYTRLRKDVEVLGNKVSSAQSRMQVIPKLIEARQSEASGIRKELDDVSKAKKEYDRTRKKMEALSVLINSLSEVQVVVRKKFVEIVNEILSNIWSQLYPYGDYSSLRIVIESDGRSAGDYILQLRERSRWISVDGFASGGERSIASLALRVAFARALSSLGLLLLDEPTHNLDQNGVNKLTDVLREGMPAVLDQVFIITHEEQMGKSSTGAAYRLIRDKEIEEPTQIERL